MSFTKFMKEVNACLKIIGSVGVILLKHTGGKSLF